MGIRLRELGVAEVAVDPVLAQHPEYLDSRFPKLTPMNPDAPSPGWTAVSTSLLKLRAGVFHGAPQPELWPERIPPTERVGKSLLLYYVAP